MDELRSAVMPTGPHHGRRRSRVAIASVVVGLVLVSSVALAYRNIWRPPPPLLNTLQSPHAVAEAVLAALHGENLESLEALALTGPEFRRYVWPELPVSQPESNVPFEFAWGMLRRNSEGHLRQTVARFKGRQLALKRVEFRGPSTTYERVSVHRDARLVIEGDDGSDQVVRLFGSLIEQDGRWKVFSYVVD